MLKENIRLFFTILWFGSTGFTLGFGLAVIVTWGGYLEYFIAALILLAISTAVVFITSL